MGGVRHAPLPVHLEQPGDDVHRLLGGPGPLEAQADQVHADERRCSRRRVVGRAHALVADGDAVLVDSVLGTPQPRRAGQERRVGPVVTDGEVLGAE